MKLSVLIPTYNGAAFLSQCLNSLINQSVNFYWEIIIVDDGSIDETPLIIKEYALKHRELVRYINIEHKGLPAAKNAGIKAARGEILLFLDDDIIIPPGLLQQLVDKMEKESLDVLGVLDLPLPNDSYLAKSARYLENFCRLTLEKGSFDVKAAAAYRRICFERAGFFDESRIYYQAEDAEFNERCKQLGLRVQLASDLRVYHRADGIKSFLRKSLLSLRHTDVPRGFFYFRCHYALLGLLMAIIIGVLTYINPVLGLVILSVLFLGGLIFSLWVSLFSAGTVTYAPGVFLVGILRTVFIFCGSAKYLAYSLQKKTKRVSARSN